MPLITGIRAFGVSRSQAGSSRLPKSGEWRLVILDDGRRLRVDVEQVARWGLEPGERAEPRLIARLEARDAYLRAREQALRLLAIRPRSAEEIRERLVRHQAPGAAIRAVIADLGADGLLDDLAFARSWITRRTSSHPVGARRIRWELRRKGVPPAVIDQALRASLGDETDRARAEEHSALALVKRRLPAVRHLAPDRQARRLAALLHRRGFATAAIVRALRALGKGEVLEALDG